MEQYAIHWNTEIPSWNTPQWEVGITRLALHLMAQDIVKGVKIEAGSEQNIVDRYIAKARGLKT